jgi:hypothetical protein
VSRICRINLSHNQLTECNSLSHLSKLKHLFVDNNKISDISFEVCACSPPWRACPSAAHPLRLIAAYVRTQGLVNLKILSLMGNELEYLTSMSDLDKLEHLNLSGNKLTAGFHELAKLKSLLSLNLSNNNFNFTLRKFYSFLLVRVPPDGLEILCDGSLVADPYLLSDWRAYAHTQLPLKKHTKLQSLAIGRGNAGANNIPDFRLWVIHELPQLKILDERPIEKSVRLPSLSVSLRTRACAVL